MPKKYKFLNVKQRTVLGNLMDWLRLVSCFLKKEIIWLDDIPKGANSFPGVLRALGISKQKFDQYFQRLNVKSIPTLITEIGISLEEIAMAERQSNSCSEAFVKIWARRRKFLSVEEAVATLILFETVLEFESDERKNPERTRKIFESIFPVRIVNIEEEPRKPSPQQERVYFS